MFWKDLFIESFTNEIICEKNMHKSQAVECSSFKQYWNINTSIAQFLSSFIIVQHFMHKASVTTYTPKRKCTQCWLAMNIFVN